MVRFILLLCCFGLPFSIRAQYIWQKSYDLIPGGFPPNSDIGLQILPSGDGFLMISGTLYNDNTTNSFGLYRLDNHGNVVFKRSFLNDENSLRAFGQDVMLELPNGDILITGDQFTGNPSDLFQVFLLKLSASGDSLWMRTYDSHWLDIPQAVLPTPDGGFLIQGTGGTEGACCRDMFLIKTDSEGYLEWQRPLGNVQEYRYSISGNFLRMDDGTLLIPFKAAAHGISKDDTYLLKTDSLGNRLWIKRLYPEITIGNPPKIRKLPDGNLALIATVDTLMPPLYNRYVVFLAKIDTAGNKLWELPFAWEGQLHYGDIEVTAAGDILIGGNKNEPSGDKAWVCKVSTTGENLWERAFLLDRDYWSPPLMYDVAECPDGGIILSGLGLDQMEGSTILDGNAWVVKLDSAGCFYPDNCQEFTLITAVAEIPPPDAPDIRVFPNPSSGEFAIELPHEWPFADLAVFDALGRLVLRRRVADRESILLPSPGWYYFAFYKDAALAKSVKVFRK